MTRPSLVKEAGVRKQFRVNVEELIRIAETKNDGSKMDLKKARAHMSGRFELADDAIADLGLAEYRCNDPILRERIDKLRQCLSLHCSRSRER